VQECVHDPRDGNAGSTLLPLLELASGHREQGPVQRKLPDAVIVEKHQLSIQRRLDIRLYCLGAHLDGEVEALDRVFGRVPGGAPVREDDDHGLKNPRSQIKVMPSMKNFIAPAS
jgi:hypothetical protein